MTVSEIRWRQPMFGPDFDHHTFKVGDRVRIARLSDGGAMTSRAILDHRGIITEIDDISPSSVEMRCSTCGGWHTMHEQELDFLGDDLIRLLSEKASIPEDPVVVNESNENLEDFLAVGMHRAGFLRIAVHDKVVPAADPRYPRPVWAKHVYGFCGRLAPFRVWYDKLIKVAEEAGGYLVELASFSHRSGYDSVVTHDDLDTLTLEMPIRALMVAKATTDMGDYDEIKDMIIYWLQDKHQIDIGAIFRAVRDLGFGMGDWHQRSENTMAALYSMNVEWKKHDGKGYDTFWEWAQKHWVWVGSFSVHIEDQGNTRDNGFGKIDSIYITKENDSEPAKVEEEQDVPF
jgi:hypothetical protein